MPWLLVALLGLVAMFVRLGALSVWFKVLTWSVAALAAVLVGGMLLLLLRAVLKRVGS